MRHPPTSRLVPYAAAALVLYVACGPGIEEPRVDDDFSELCDGTPCGWTVIGGRVDQARLGEGFHPGTYALRLEGEVAVQRDTRLTVFDRSRVQLEVTIRCDQRELITSTLIVERDEDAGAPPRRITSSADADAGWGRAVFVFETDGGSIRSFTIAKRGATSCDIGYIHMSTTRLTGTC